MHNRSAEELFLDNSQQTKACLIALNAISQVENAMDILYSTPLRDLQVFSPDSFGAIANLEAHNFLSPVMAAFNIIGSLPFIAKLFTKNTVNNLGEMLNNLADEYDIKINLLDPYTKEKIIQRLNGYLKKRGLYHLQADIEQKNNKTKLKFKYINPMGDLLNKHWHSIKEKSMMEVIKFIFFTLNKSTETKNDKHWTKLLAKTKKTKEEKVSADQEIILLIKGIFHSTNNIDNQFNEAAALDLLELLKNNSSHIVELVQNNDQFSQKQKDVITILSRIYGCFIGEDGEFNLDLTLEKSREEFIKRINKISVSEAANNTYGTINDYTFNFWLCYFTTDLLDGREDMGQWDYKNQVLVLAIAGAISGIQLVLKLVNYFKNRQTADTPLDTYSNKALKHNLLEEFFIEEICNKQLDKANDNQFQYPFNFPLANKKIENILSNQDENETSKISQDFNFLRQNYGADQSHVIKRTATVITNMMDQAILISFIGWVIGAICVAAGAAIAGAAILSTPVGLAFFAAGLIFGATWFADRQIQKDKEKEKSMAQQLEKNAPKIHELVVLERQNKELRALLKEKNIQPLTVIKAHDDRAFRRLTTKSGGVLTTVKKVLNRTFFGIGKAGSGILIVRLAILPIFALGCVAVTLSNPVAFGIALGFGIAWAAVNVYKYHQERKLAKCERTLNDIDNRILAAKSTQEVYLKQLRYSKTNDLKNIPKQQSIQPSSPQLTSSNELLPAYQSENSTEILENERTATYSLSSSF